MRLLDFPYHQTPDCYDIIFPERIMSRFNYAPTRRQVRFSIVRIVFSFFFFGVCKSSSFNRTEKDSVLRNGNAQLTRRLIFPKYFWLVDSYYYAYTHTEYIGKLNCCKMKTVFWFCFSEFKIWIDFVSISSVKVTVTGSMSFKPPF